MRNNNIFDAINNLTKLLELHGADKFKVNSYKKASRIIKNLSVELNTLSFEEIMNIHGFGKSISMVIKELIDTGTLKSLNELIEKTPIDVINMLKMNGIGASKIFVIWKRLNIDSFEKLIDACKNNIIANTKGFGIKTQETILKEISYLKQNLNKHIFPTAFAYAEVTKKMILNIFPNIKILISGELRRKMEIINFIDLIIIYNSKTDIISWLYNNDYFLMQSYKLADLNNFDLSNTNDFLDFNQNNTKIEQDILKINGSYFLTIFASLKEKKDLKLRFSLCSVNNISKVNFLLTGSNKHIQTLESEYKDFKKNLIEAKDEQKLYDSLKIQYIFPEMREGKNEVSLAKEKKLPILIENKDIKGIFHAHSTYSDGINSLYDMAKECKKLGYEYLGITDHSQTAVYAGGLKIEDIKRQHLEIERINKELYPFKIFKGIESDILKDGSLDYDDEILKSFDFIIASIHSGQKMTKEVATERLINAIRNPYTTFLGHMTGRLLLRRNGYPIDYEKVLEECAKNNVIVELNANPNRLDIDWRWIDLALEKNCLVSINPDAHSINGFNDIQYGINMARKAGLSNKNVFNCFDLKIVEKHFLNK